MPLRVTEWDSVASAAAAASSNVFAASLWGVEHMYTLAEHGAVRRELPWLASVGVPTSRWTASRATIRPGPSTTQMLIFHIAAQGQTIPVAGHYAPERD